MVRVCILPDGVATPASSVWCSGLEMRKAFGEHIHTTTATSTFQAREACQKCVVDKSLSCAAVRAARFPRLPPALSGRGSPGRKNKNHKIAFLCRSMSGQITKTALGSKRGGSAGQQARQDACGEQLKSGNAEVEHVVVQNPVTEPGAVAKLPAHYKRGHHENRHVINGAKELEGSSPFGHLQKVTR